MKIIIAFLFLIFQTVLGESPNVQHIINGSDTQLGEYPYMVGIRRFEEDIYCGGAIISNKHVITAAHCVDGYEVTDLVILVGTNDLLNGGDYYDVEKITISEDYVATKAVGIAVITVAKEIQFSKYVSKIDLSKSNTPDGATTTLTGFGFQENDNETGHMSQILQKLPVKIVNQEECKHKLANYEVIEPQQLCGFTGLGYGACYGDSGSPLVYENALIGLAMGVYPECAAGYPDVYARITYYLDFIEQIIF